MFTTIEFIILTWNSEGYICNCLESILSLEQFQTKIHVIDNGSSDQTVNLIKQNYPSVDLTTLSSNIGTTKSRNIGLANLSKSTDYICILDSDTIVNSEAITQLVEALKHDSKGGIAVPKMHNMKGNYQHSCKKFPTVQLKLLKALPVKTFEQLGKNMELYDLESASAPIYVDYGISACWMIKKSCLDAVGLLDEAIYYAPEDVDYCLRSWKKNYKVIFVPTADIIHDTQRISKKKLISRLNYEHVKGLLYYFHKHGYSFRRPKF